MSASTLNAIGFGFLMLGIVGTLVFLTISVLRHRREPGAGKTYLAIGVIILLVTFVFIVPAIRSRVSRLRDQEGAESIRRTYDLDVISASLSDGCAYYRDNAGRVQSRVIAGATLAKGERWQYVLASRPCDGEAD